MADGISKYVAPFLINNWSRGADIFSFSQDLGPVVKRGDSVDIPSLSSVTIGTSETLANQTLTTSPNAMTVNRTKMANVRLGNRDSIQLMDGAARDRYLTKMLGDLRNALIRDYIEHLIRDVAGASAANHVNLAADAITEADVNEIEAVMLEQAGPDRSRMFWLVAPRTLGSLKNVADYVPADPIAAQSIGIGPVRSVNGYPSLDSSLMPGGEDAYRLTVATTAVTIASNVATATVTVPAGSTRHGFVVGQMIYTTGLTTNVPVTSPVAITATTATTISFPLTASDGALADGVGTIHSASAMGVLVDGSRLFHAFAGLIPQFFEVKLQGDAGFELQLVTHFGRQAIDGAVKVIHSPDN